MSPSLSLLTGQHFERLAQGCPQTRCLFTKARDDHACTTYVAHGNPKVRTDIYGLEDADLYNALDPETYIHEALTHWIETVHLAGAVHIYVCRLCGGEWHNDLRFLGHECARILIETPELGTSPAELAFDAAQVWESWL